MSMAKIVKLYNNINGTNVSASDAHFYNNSLFGDAWGKNTWKFKAY